MANKFTILNLRELCFVTDSELSDSTQSQPHPHTSQEQSLLADEKLWALLGTVQWVWQQQCKGVLPEGREMAGAFCGGFRR